jgi:hypothetical protein
VEKAIESESEQTKLGDSDGQHKFKLLEEDNEQAFSESTDTD